MLFRAFRFRVLGFWGLYNEKHQTKKEVGLWRGLRGQRCRDSGVYLKGQGT